MPIIIKSVLPEGTVVTVYLMVILAINTFEGIYTRFVFQSLKSRRVCLKISFAVQSQVAVVFNFMWAITFLTLGTMNLVCKCSMSPFPTVFTLEDTKIHVGFIDYSYVASDIKASIY